jgi:hypothetical protein
MNIERQLKPGNLYESVPQRVRENAAMVAGQAGFVRIHADRIADYTAGILRRYPVITSLDAQSHFLSEASPEQTANFVLALDSVNFGSGFFKIAAEAGVALEYKVISGGLRQAFGESRLNTPYKWLAVTVDECHDIFNVPKGARPALDRLMALFADHLGATGQQIVENYDGQVLNLLEAAGNSASRLVDMVAAWPTFRDMAMHKGHPVAIFKRAQILAADMHLAFEGKGPAAFDDIDMLTCFADNMVPHVLRCDGILEYAPQLAAQIDAGEMIAAQSAAEIEIRACGIHAVELMKRAAMAQLHPVTSVNIDHILWNRGYEPAIYSKPSHKTLTVWY